MLYRNYLKDKIYNSDKFSNSEGVPCVLKHSKGKNIKNYEIYGNTTQKTSVGKNLLYSTVSTVTSNGVTLVNNNGTITLNGTCTGHDTFNLQNIYLSAGTYTLSGNSNKIPVSNNNSFIQLYGLDTSQNISLTNSDATGDITVTTSHVGTFSYRIHIDDGVTYNDVILKPQLETGSLATEYETYWKSPSIKYPSEVESVGELTTKNLFDKNNANLFSGYISNHKINGYYESPTAPYKMLYIDCKPNTTYTVSRQILSKRFTVGISNNAPGANVVINNSISRDNLLSITITTGENDIYLYVWFYNENVDNEYTCEEIMNGIQIEEGSVATEYEPYHKYNIPIVVSGKNLISTPEFKNSVSNTITYENGIWYIVPDETKSPTACVLVNTFNVKAGETITISCKLNHHGYRTNGLRYYNVKTGNTISYIGNCGVGSGITPSIELTTYSKSYTASQDVTIGFNVYVIGFIDEDGDGINDAYPIDFADLQIEYGNTATDYESYKEPIISNIYLNEPLRKAGNYADYIDFRNQKVVRKIKEKYLNGTETWVPYGVHNGFRCSIDDMMTLNLGYGFCNYFARGVGSENIRFGANSKSIYVHYVYTTENPVTVDEWKTKIAEWSSSDNPIYIIYILATPIEENIQLPILKSFKNTTVITTKTKLSPSDINVKYIRA